MNQRDIFERWQQVAQPAAWLIASFGFILGFSIRLSSTSPGPDAVVGVSGVVIAVAIAVLRPLLKRRSTARTFPRQAAWACFCLMSFLVSWSGFSVLRDSWTCPYSHNTRLVVGSSPTELLREYIARSPVERAGHAGACRMIKEYAGATGDMYKYREVAVRYYTLIGIHFLAWLSITAVLLATIELLVRPKRAMRKPRTPKSASVNPSA